MDHRLNVLQAIETKFGRIECITRPALQTLCLESNIVYPQWLTTAQIYRKERGVYNLPWNLLKHPNKRKHLKKWKRILQYKMKQIFLKKL